MLNIEIAAGCQFLVYFFMQFLARFLFLLTLHCECTVGKERKNYELCLSFFQELTMLLLRIYIHIETFFFGSVFSFGNISVF